MTVTLYSGELQEGTHTYQSAYISGESGDLVFEAQDIGSLPESVWGDSDYEWFVTVPSANKQAVFEALQAEHHRLGIEGEGDAMLLALLRAVFGGRRDAVDAARKWLEEKSIGYSFSSWA